MCQYTQVWEEGFPGMELSIVRNRKGGSGTHMGMRQGQEAYQERMG